MDVPELTDDLVDRIAALRDRRPTTIPGVEERRHHFEKLFKKLRRAKVGRQDLVLAFDFVV